MVLCSHILWIYPQDNGLLSQVFVLFGFWGVELFFVLSGFLIGKILYKSYVEQDFTLQSVFCFLKRRWFRTLPNYFLVLLLNVVIAFIIGLSLTDIGYYLFFLQNFATTMKPFFPESWSLSVEEFAYMFMPLALLLSSFLIKHKNKSKRFISVVLILILMFFINKVIYQLTSSNTTLEQWNLSLKEVVVYRIDSILIGVVAAWVSLNFSEFWKKHTVLFVSIGCVFIGLMYVGVGYFRILIDSYPFFWNVLYLPVTSITFVFFLPFLSQWENAPKWIVRPVTFVSLVSYSVYLLHYSIVLQLMKYFLDTPRFTMMQLHGFTFGYLVLTFFLSFLLYKYFEKPMMNLRDR
ncbi:acyltransferase family protein [Flavobacterium limnosediminis JC2902]|uniref:Acyltransferase family protein n=2 Tax=Flavobacterium TaxID=237 RepID=V6SRD3_9FLAO|nr:acyltransferase family protein [Flavobacterium limnosediminis JC2902]